MSATVTITGPGGARADYALRRLGPTDYRVEKPDGPAYEVALGPGGWECTCPAYRYRHARGRSFARGSCKHCTEVARVHALLSALARPEETP